MQLFVETTCFSVPVGALQWDLQLAVTIPSVCFRSGIPLWLQWHPAEHQTRRQHALSSAGLQNIWLQRRHMPGGWTGGREEDLPVGAEPVGQMGADVHPELGTKETARWGREEHMWQEQRRGALPGPQRSSEAAWPRQLWRHLLPYLRGVPRVQQQSRANSRAGVPLWHSTPNQGRIRRIPFRSPWH